MNLAGAVANEFLDLAEQEGKEITNLKLVKLMYIAQGLSLAFYNEPLFYSDIEAWRYGPVIPEIYHEFKHFKDMPITEKSVDLDGSDWDTIYTPKLEEENKKKVVQLTWQWYKEYSAGQLVDFTHAKGTPWRLTYVPEENRVIPEELIKKYYKLFLKNMKREMKN